MLIRLRLMKGYKGMAHIECRHRLAFHAAIVYGLPYTGPTARIRFLVQALPTPESRSGVCGGVRWCAVLPDLCVEWTGAGHHPRRRTEEEILLNLKLQRHEFYLLLPTLDEEFFHPRWLQRIVDKNTYKVQSKKLANPFKNVAENHQPYPRQYSARRYFAARSLNPH